MGAATAVRERPILFSGPMIKAILSGQKTVTRRVIKPQPPEGSEIATINEAEGWWEVAALPGFGGCMPNVSRGAIACPYGEAGDRLWVRETFRVTGASGYGGVTNAVSIEYRAGGAKIFPATWEQYDKAAGNTEGWRPSIVLPRWASRITLEVVSVRIERVQDITPQDAAAEGFDLHSWSERGVLSRDALMGFRDLWDKLNGPRGFGWDSNPFVWVISFRRIE